MIKAVEKRQKILILMATFNGEHWISEQISSILNQTLHLDVDICISDDGSIDGTTSLINALASENKSIHCLSAIQNSGSAAQNFFRLLRDVDFSTSEYIALSDQDDIWLPTKLSRAVTQLNNSQADAYSCNVIAFWPNGTKVFIQKSQPQQLHDYMFESAGPGCTFVFTRKLAEEIQAFLIANHEECKQVALHDWFIYAYARSHGFKWLIDDEHYMLYRQHDENVMGANVGFKANFLRFKKLQAGWLREQALLLANILGYANSLPILRLKKYRFVDRLWLITNVRKLRRRLRDQFALLFLLCIQAKK